MCPQFVDFDADGYTDIITATYAGSPYLVRGSSAGWQKPQVVVNENGTPIRLGMYWDFDKKQWCNADGSAMDGSNTDGHCVSAAVFDWDNDRDFDLLIGSYEGALHLHRNVGEVGNAKFAANREPVQVNGRPFQLEGGLTAPRMIDWDGDGLTDIVAGGFKGGAYLYRNTGKAGEPKFESAVALIAKSDTPTGAAAGPNSGLYVDPVDYDNDGDLDLLVGGYAQWQPQPRTLTDAERERIKQLEAEMQTVGSALQEIYASFSDELESAASNEERRAIHERMMAREDYKEQSARQQELWEELSQLQPQPERQAGVWLYRRQG